MRSPSIYTILFFIVVTLGWMLSCQKHLNVKDVISIHSTSDTALADGRNEDTIYADLPIDALVTLRGVTFKASSGLFANGSDTMSVFANRTDITIGKITATVVWHAALRSGPDTLSASTSTVPLEENYLYLTLLPSVAASIQLTPSAYQLTNAFGMQVMVTGLLQNSNGGMVSDGVRIQFTDVTDGGTPAGGRFQPAIAVLDSASAVSTVYFPLQLTTGSTGAFINIAAVVLDASGNPTGPSAATRIFISPS